MNGYDIEKTIQELQEQIDNNNEQNLVNDERSRMARVNQIGTKIEETITFSILPCVGLNIASMSMFYNGTMAHITNTIPAESIPLIIAGGSLALGTLAMELVNKKFRIVERLKSFSTAETDEEKKEEQVRYEIEQEKIKRRNRAIEEAINTIRENHERLESLSKYYIITDRNMPLSEEEIQMKIEEISSTLNQKLEELDLQTTRLALNDYYSVLKTGFEKSLDTSTHAILSGATIMMYYSLPVISMQGLMGNQNLAVGLANVFGPLIAGSVGSAVYISTNKRNLEQALNNINNSLGNDKISRSQSLEYKLSLAQTVDKTVDEVSDLIVELYKQKRELEKFCINSPKKETSKEEGPSLLLRRTIEE